MQKHRPPGKRKVRPEEVDDGGLLRKDIEGLIKKALRQRKLMDFEQILMEVQKEKRLAKRGEVLGVLQRMDREAKVKTKTAKLGKTSIVLFSLA